MRVFPLALLMAAACAESAPTPTDLPRESAASFTSSTVPVTIMTQNMYVGADLDAVIAALASPDTSDDVPALLNGIQTLGVTDYPARAGALAAEIDHARPDVVGLQEVSKIDITIPGLVDLHIDFLPVLLDSLAAHGAHYVAAASVLNIVASPVPGIELHDFDAMLVNTDRVTVTGSTGRNYAANLGVVAPGVELKRGYVVVQSLVAGQPITFASTHLESGDSPGLPDLRAAQAAELAGALPAGAPVYVMGDFNDVPGSPAYQVMQGAGLTDTWGTLKPSQPGLTCCETPDLGTQTNVFTQRIDYVWTTVPVSNGSAKVERVGERPGDRVAGPVHPIWPSDHAGLVFGVR